MLANLNNNYNQIKIKENSYAMTMNMKKLNLIHKQEIALFTVNVNKTIIAQIGAIAKDAKISMLSATPDQNTTVNPKKKKNINVKPTLNASKNI